MEKPRPIHERVKDHVDESGHSVAELAALTKWSERRVSRLLTGITEFSAGDMEVLARVLGKSVIALYRGKQSKPDEVAS